MIHYTPATPAELMAERLLDARRIGDRRDAAEILLLLACWPAREILIHIDRAEAICARRLASNLKEVSP